MNFSEMNSNLFLTLAATLSGSSEYAGFPWKYQDKSPVVMLDVTDSEKILQCEKSETKQGEWK